MNSASGSIVLLRTGVTLAVIVWALVGHSTPVCVHPPAGLVSSWPGENAANDIVGNNDGTLMGGVTFGLGMVGGAFSFDGTDDYVNVSAEETLHPPALTIDLWLQAVSLSDPPGTSASSLMTSNLGDLDGYQLQIENDGRVGLVIGGGTQRTYYTSNVAVIGVGQWYHLAVSYDGVGGAGSVKLYINGIPTPFALHPAGDFAEPVGPIYYSGAYPLTIGRRNQPAVGNFNGLIDEVDIYDRALTPSEVLALYAAGGIGKCKVIAVSIDIKPGGAPNSINPHSKGLIPVAILTTATFDAKAVNPNSILFGPTGTEAAPVRAGLTDVNDDGIFDMLLHVNTQATKIQCGDVSAELSGETLDGHVIRGADLVNTVACR